MNLSRRHFLYAGSALAAAGLPLRRAAFAASEKFPTRPVEMIVPWGPGGGADQLARQIGKLAEPMFGQGVPVVNVPGGTGATGMAKLLATPPDGYSAAIYIADAHALLAGSNPRWQLSDITPAAVMIQAPSFIFVAQDSRFKTWADFEKEARASPNKLKVATLGFGSVDDFTLSYLAGKGVNVIQVPFSKPSERYVSILGGHADALYEQAGDVGSFLAGKQMRPLLVFGKERFPAFKDVPCSYELGYQVALPQFRAVVLRAGTPEGALSVFDSVMGKVAATEEYKKFLTEQIADPNSYLTASQSGAFLEQQLSEMKALAKPA